MAVENRILYQRENINFKVFLVYLSMLKLCWQIFVESHLWTKVFYLAKFAFTNFWILISKKPLILREAKKFHQHHSSYSQWIDEISNLWSITQCGKNKNSLSLENFLWNQFTIWFVSKNVDFTEFLWKNCERSKIA